MKFIYFLFILVLLLSCGSHENPESFNKKKSDSLNLKAYYFLNVNNFDSAKYFIDQALLLDSTNFGAYNNRAVVNFRVNGESKKIIEDFETALKNHKRLSGHEMIYEKRKLKLKVAFSAEVTMSC